MIEVFMCLIWTPNMAYWNRQLAQFENLKEDIKSAVTKECESAHQTMHKQLKR